jgi:hypothetical protein
MLAWYAVAVMGLGGPVRFFCQDETRLGLKTISGRKITAKGIKPKGKVQWQFKATYTNSSRVGYRWYKVAVGFKQQLWQAFTN